MNRFLLTFLLSFTFAGILSAQNSTDSNAIPHTDTTVHPAVVLNYDSINRLQEADSVSKRPKEDSSFSSVIRSGFSAEKFNQQVLKHHPYFGFRAHPETFYSSKKEFNGKEILFYVLIMLFILFAFFRQLFSKYFNDLFRVFFRTTLKQRQIREQLMQTPLASLLFNCFFLVSAALYADFLVQHFKLLPVYNFWLSFLYCGIAISAIYLIKFLGLKFSGWVFNMQEATDSYIFIIFIVNKIIGIFLLPVLLLLAFTGGNIFLITLSISWCGIGVLLGYRIILSFSVVRNQVSVNLFHFFLYICAFEIAPLLLIYKILIYFFQ